MKKNLRNVLALALGLITTVSFAQDWNVDSRTRIDMSDAIGGDGYKQTDQRVTLGATWGGSDWGIHVSSDAEYRLGGAATSMGIYEAYASTDLFGMANMTIGRQALSYGSGALMSGRDWSSRTTWDGMSFALGLSDMADITVGYASMNTGMTAAILATDGTDSIASAATDDNGNMHINIGGEFSGWNVNVLYMTETGLIDNAGTLASDDAATGIDISGGLMGATVSASMNSDFDGHKMNSYGLSYAINDDLSVSVNSTTYGEGSDTANASDGFSMRGTDMDGGDWSNGGLGYLNANDEDLSYGLSYNLGGISLSATMHNITNAADEDHERTVTQIGIGYALGNNANLGISYATDATEAVTTVGNESDATDAKYTWVTLTVTP